MAKQSKNPGKGHAASTMFNILETTCTNHKGFMEANQSDDGAPTFGRLCGASPKPNKAYKDALVTLGKNMEDNGGGDGPAAAGMTFLGQFIDHDLTLDATTSLDMETLDVETVSNLRTPRLDLDCVYGDGPDASPMLFDQSVDGKLLFGRHPGEGHAEANFDDFARNRDGTALIGDPRNDENLFVNQVHGRMFVARHNQLVSKHGSYEEARKKLTHEYHTMIVKEFLPAVVEPKTLKHFLDWLNGGEAPKTGKLDWSHVPDMPVEFSAAAYRFGHSMVRQRYDLNEVRRGEAIFNGRLEGFAPVERGDNLLLSLFFGEDAQKARPIDTKIPKALTNLPESVVGDGEANLAFRNMQRGQVTFRLPFGPELARFLGCPVIEPHSLVKGTVLEKDTPLWFYILAEAEEHCGKLGPLGGTLVAGVLINLMIKGKSPLAKKPRKKKGK